MTGVSLTNAISPAISSRIKTPRRQDSWSCSFVPAWTTSATATQLQRWDSPEASQSLHAVFVKASIPCYPQHCQTMPEANRSAWCRICTCSLDSTRHATSLRSYSRSKPFLRLFHGARNLFLVPGEACPWELRPIPAPISDFPETLDQSTESFSESGGYRGLTFRVSPKTPNLTTALRAANLFLCLHHGRSYGPGGLHSRSFVVC